MRTLTSHEHEQLNKGSYIQTLLSLLATRPLSLSTIHHLDYGDISVDHGRVAGPLVKVKVCLLNNASFLI